MSCCKAVLCAEVGGILAAVMIFLDPEQICSVSGDEIEEQVWLCYVSGQVLGLRLHA
jgi:hypothetical protein